MFLWFVANINSFTGSKNQWCCQRLKVQGLKAQGQRLEVQGQGLKAQGQGLVVEGQGREASNVWYK